MLDKVLSDAVIISPETVSFRVKRENLYKRPHIKSLRFFPTVVMNPHPNILCGIFFFYFQITDFRCGVDSRLFKR